MHLDTVKEAPRREEDFPHGLVPRSPWWGQALKMGTFLGLCISGRVGFRMRIRGKENFINEPRMVLLLGHKADEDAQALSQLMLLARWSGPLTHCGSVAGELIFLKGFMGGYVVREPVWLSRLFFKTTVGKAMRGYRALPMRPGRWRFLMGHLEDVLALHGDLPLGVIFEAPVESILPGASPDMPVSEAMGFPFRDALFTRQGFEIFRPAIRESLLIRHREDIAVSIDEFASILNDGDTLIMAPEGVLSEDGRIGPIRSGLHQILAKTRDEITVLPLSATYDFMTTGRVTCFLTIGKAIRGVERMSKHALRREMARALASLNTVTLGQLAAHHLAERAALGEFKIEEVSLREAVVRLAREFDGEGYEVDPSLLSERHFERRWRRFMTYCDKRGLLLRDGSLLEYVPDENAPDLLTGGRTASWAYSLNELETLVRSREGAVYQGEGKATAVNA